jgi:hypothetical protein
MTRLYVAILSLGVILGFGVVSKAHSMSYGSFSNASFSGVTLTPSFTNGVLDYTLALSPTGQIKIGSSFYNILWLQGLYVVGATSSNNFTATNGVGNPSGWSYDTSPNSSPFNVAGWDGNASAVRIYQGESKTFHFGSLNLGSPAVPTVVGLHVGYSGPNGSPVTAFFKDNEDSIHPLPEPSSLFGLGTALISAIAYIRRRRK